MIEQFRLLRERYHLSERVADGSAMSGGKPLPLGPVGRWTQGFPYLPLPHPVHSLGHFVFPNFYLQVHPELERVDADFDLPAAYLPESPPPLFLVTRPDLGDVSKGREINLENFRWLLEGVLTPEQLEGLRLLLTPRPTLWFNRTEHRLSPQPVEGVSCFACHVNGHTNGAILLEPSTRPSLASVRLDTPSLRGVGRARLLGSKRAIHSLAEFAVVEDYFEGELFWAKHIGAKPFTGEEALAISAFLSAIDFPPAPRLGPEGRLDPALATPSQRRGEEIFFRKGRGGTCHPAPFYSDHQMHDLQVERFTGGRPEGAFKTPTLRGIKDSPPYFHDGRLPTLEDAVDFFDSVLGLHLSDSEKKDLVEFLKIL